MLLYEQRATPVAAGDGESATQSGTYGRLRRPAAGGAAVAAAVVVAARHVRL